MPKIVCEKGKCIHPQPMAPTRHFWRPPSALAPIRGNQFAVHPPRQALVQFHLQPPPFSDFHMPEHVAAKIVSLVSEDGVDMLKAWIQSGPDGKAAVFSRETLSSVRLDKSPSLVLAFHMCELQEAIAILDGIKDVFPHAGLLYIMLHSCAESIPWEFYSMYKRRYYKFSEVDLFADKLMFHINEVGPRRQGTYKNSWEFEDYGECWSDHQNLNEYEGQWCNTCNPYALYLHSLSLGFRCFDLCGAISILSTCKDRFPLAELLYIALNRCAGIELIDDFNSFNRENKCFFDVSLMANKLIGHISASEPKCFGSYSETFLYEEYPDCWLIHELNNEFNGERCSQCLYFYLFRDILLFS
uniref:Emb/CAB86478.1 n=1 Tax=Arabidopsis thaliana TaxID=3702 RepID=Q9FHK2_ARATH|nr:unnamed protein product [Arabidopsis thaliana]